MQCIINDETAAIKSVCGSRDAIWRGEEKGGRGSSVPDTFTAYVRGGLFLPPSSLLAYRVRSAFAPLVHLVPMLAHIALLVHC